MSRRHTLFLPSGLRLLVTEMPHLHAASLSAVVGCGSRHEDARTWGLTHLVEHMLFRGSACYPDARRLVAPFERAGGTLNAETWRDHTHFAATLHPAGLPAAVRALGDMLARPTWPELEAERALVQAELGADLDGEGDDALDADLTNLGRAIVWPNHPLGRRITGSPARVRAFDVADLQAYHRRHYHAGNVVVSLAGPLGAARWLPRLAEAFRDLPPAHAGPERGGGRRNAPTFAPDRPYTAVDVAQNQVSLQLAFEAVGEDHRDFVALQLLANVLDDGMGTRLHRALSERSGLVYAFQSGLDCYRDVGLYELEMQLSPQRTVPALAAALDTLATVASRGVGVRELQLAKRRATLARHLAADAVADAAYEAALDVAFARPDAAAQARARQNVACADLQRLARQLFVDGRRHAVLLGPLAQVDRVGVARLLRASAPAVPRRRPARPSARAAAKPTGRAGRSRA